MKKTPVKPILSVVRLKHVDVSDESLYESSTYATEYYQNLLGALGARDRWVESVKYHNSFAGKYVKSGGSDPTDNLQEAQIFGWSRSAKANLAKYDVMYFEVLPISVELV